MLSVFGGYILHTFIDMAVQGSQMSALIVVNTWCKIVEAINGLLSLVINFLVMSN